MSLPGRRPRGLAALLAAVRPPSLPGQEQAWERFEQLLGELLVQGSVRPAKDIAQMRRELARPGHQAFAAFAIQHEYGRILMTVAALGPGPLVPPEGGRRGTAAVVRVLWPPAIASQYAEVLHLGNEAQACLKQLAALPGGQRARRWIAALNPAWALPYLRPRRARGRRESVSSSAAVRAALEQAMSGKGGVTTLGVAKGMTTILPRQPSEQTVRRYVRRAKATGGRPPAGWHETLLAERLRPLWLEAGRLDASAERVDVNRVRRALVAVDTAT